MIQNKKQTASNKTYRLTGLGMLTALIIVLQLFSTYLTNLTQGQFSVTFALVPIVIGAAVYGARAGAYLGAVFSVVVIFMCVFGFDKGGAIVWNANPFMCAVLCMLKGTAAGFVGGLLYRLLEKFNKIVATVVAAIAVPLVNTGIFWAGLYIFFRPVLYSWAGDTGVVFYVLSVLTGINFIIELGTNIVLSPIIVKILDALKKNKVVK